MQTFDTIKNYYKMTKPGIVRMTLITVSIGFYLGSMGVFYPYKVYIALLLGTFLVASACGILNSVVESDLDKLMERTKNRPIPQGLIDKKPAIVLAVVFAFFGLLFHFVWVNMVTMLISAITLVLYIFVYTPLKKRTWLNTLVGSIPGALPILGGWTAATNSVDAYAGMLFFVLFAWQQPHFYALAIMYKDDYARGGFKMLPVLDNSGWKTKQQILIYTILMVFVSVFPYMFGLLGEIYCVGVLLIGFSMFYFGIQICREYTFKNAKKLFFSSIIYLPIWFVLMVLDFLILS
tara:strand:+ start:329 stop:1204 length:876 start_codon:yes stop_codon:yes gene_type:complete